MSKSIEDVRAFWETNPLWSGESEYALGSKAFFEEHRRIYIEDCFAGAIDDRLFPEEAKDGKVLDLGCGTGFWTTEFGLEGFEDVVAVDLTHGGLELTRKRCIIHGVEAQLAQQNAEQIAFLENSFDHVNCLGVIHHTPNTEACVSEIARVLKPGGTANISVYYTNILLRHWHLLRRPGSVLAKLGVGMRGRGRESMLEEDDVNEIVRLYDGQDNPIGKAYSREQISSLVLPYFEIEDIWQFFFPARSFPISLPGRLHRFLDKRIGFMICASLRKR